MDISHHTLSHQPAPAPGSTLDDALPEIRARLGCAPQRLRETNRRPIRFGRGKSAWAFAHYVNGTWFVHYGDWRTGERYTWTSHSRHGLTDAELRRYNEEIRRLLEQERLKREGQQAAVARSVQAQWEALPPAPANHPYLVRKGVQPHGLRARAGSLVVPLRDIAGQLWSWQTIDAEGRKQFYKGGRAKGLFFTFAQPGQLEAANTILVGEGWATGATLHETLALPVVAAMNASNLLPVVQALHEKYPHHRLVICADDDWHGKGDCGKDNAGLTEARKAAAAVGGQVAVPVWSGKRGKKDTDFNDLALLEGRAAVRRIIEAVLAAPAPGETTDSVPGVPDSPGVPDEGKAPGKAKGKAKAKDKAPDKAAPGPEKAEDKVPGKGNALRQSPQPVRPGLDERPCFWLVEEQTVIGGRRYEAGVYHCGIKHEKQCGEVVPVPTETWLSSPIRLLARTVEWRDGAQGIRLAVWDGCEWRDAILPREALASRRYREILYGRGAQLTPENRPELAGYLQQDTASREYVTSRAGWHDRQYVLPDTTIGEGTTISFVGLRPTDEPLTAGELADWQKSVAALAAGNPLLAFSISLAFAAPLLKLVGRDAVLIGLVGPSTSGKTTCLLTANSVVGPPALATSWYTTASGLEQQALLRCDGFFALDEIGQVEPEVLDHAIYALANGTVKQRAQAYEHGVGAAPAQRWRVTAISTGEKTLETLLATGRRSVNAGQAVRFIEISVAEPHGAFTELHGYGSGAAFADALRRSVHRYYGTPLRSFLKQLVCDGVNELDAELSKYVARLRKAVESNGMPVGAQASRVLTSMALVGLAGELATSCKITGWNQGEAFKAALHCYRLWAQSRPTQTDFEQVDILRRMRDFLDKYGDSKFSECTKDVIVHDRAGYYRDTDDGREYLFTSDGFQDAVRGFDFKLARKTLADLNVLKTSGGRDTVTARLKRGYKRLFCVQDRALDEALEKLGG